jgi:hypothetical protein
MVAEITFTHSKRLWNVTEKRGVMAPNANRIMKDLIGHASELGLSELAEVFRDAFDPDVRNAIAHADYINWNDGLRLRRRNGGQPRVISWDEFDALVRRGLNLFSVIRQIAADCPSSEFLGQGRLKIRESLARLICNVMWTCLEKWRVFLG